MQTAAKYYTEILKRGPIFVAYHTDEDHFWTLL